MGMTGVRQLGFDRKFAAAVRVDTVGDILHALGNDFKPLIVIKLKLGLRRHVPLLQVAFNQPFLIDNRPPERDRPRCHRQAPYHGADFGKEQMR